MVPKIVTMAMNTHTTPRGVTNGSGLRSIMGGDAA